MAIRSIRTLFATAVVVLVSCLPVPALAFSQFVVFGDSLSDTGNDAVFLGIDATQVITGNTYIPDLPYGSGRFSNAGVWTEGFGAALDLPAFASLDGGSLYAYGGARTRVPSPLDVPPLRAQLSAYLSDVGGVADPDALYVVAGGGNNARDTLEALESGAPIITTILVEARRYAVDIGLMVDALQAAGAQHIIVWNTPNLSLAPAVAAEGDLAVKLAQVVVGRMNEALARRLAGEPGVTVFDSYGFFTQVLSNPAGYGLANVTDACGALPGCDPSTYFFWDGIHPTSAGHAILTEAMLAIVGAR